MIVRATRRYERLQRELETDGEYRMLEARRRVAEAAFQAAMAHLPEHHRDSVLEYIGICGEMAERSTELACWLT